MNVFSRFLPERLASQLLALLTLALLLAFMISIVVTVYAQRFNDRGVRDKYAAERVNELTTILGSLAAGNRQQFAKSAGTRTTSIKVEPDPAVLFTAENDRSRKLADEITTAIERKGVRASVLSRIDFSIDGDPRESGRNREVIAVSVPIGPDEWLNFNSREPLSWYTRTEQQFMFFIFGVSFLLVTGFAWFFVRKLTLPIEAFAAAARKSAGGDRSASIPVIGPAEFKDAAIAFNSMQTQIELFESERTRTIAAMAHDLRTPLTSLRVRTEMIDNQDLREPMIKTLEDVSAMADGLMSYAHHKQEEALTERVDLHAIVTALACEYGLSFESNIYPEVVGGPVSLSRAIRNLIENANRYAKLESISVERDANKAVICIWDIGPGISDELMSTIREPFVRGESSRNVETGGYGLGLAITSEIISSHGGELILENYGQGLCAKLVIPVSPESVQ